MRDFQINPESLTKAFPKEIRPEAAIASAHIIESLIPDLVARPIKSFAVNIADQELLIPYRLYFESCEVALPPDGTSRLVARALQTRAGCGLMRQKALRELLLSRPAIWVAPFIIALIGEYLIEILDDIDAGMTPETEQTLGMFINANPSFWATTKRRVASYWNAYYRHAGREYPRGYTWERYVGFRLLNRLNTAARKAAR